MSGFMALAEAVATQEVTTMPSKWIFGGSTLAVFLLLLWIVTRINIDR
ncbi:MAG: hypothetical protein WCI29_13275 [Actinomycetes bacterium]|jgi:hypothetical protein